MSFCGFASGHSSRSKFRRPESALRILGAAQWGAHRNADPLLSAVASTNKLIDDCDADWKALDEAAAC
jgi:hypothetical protein